MSKNQERKAGETIRPTDVPSNAAVHTSHNKAPASSKKWQKIFMKIHKSCTVGLEPIWCYVVQRSLIIKYTES